MDLGICSDTHGRVAPKFDPAAVSAVLHGGDAYDAANGPDPDGDPLAPWLTRCSAPVFFVRGNHDQIDEWGWFNKYQDLTGRLAVLGPGLFLAGVGFTPQTYSDMPSESDLSAVCEQVRRTARELMGPSDRLVLLTHYPAKFPQFYMVQKAGWSFDCVRELIEELRPVAAIQGHIHQWFGRRHQLEIAGQRIFLVHPGPHGGVLRIHDPGNGASYVPSRP
jgi:Icc-related predicted phosphoesterase